MTEAKICIVLVIGAHLPALTPGVPFIGMPEDLTLSRKL